MCAWMGVFACHTDVCLNYVCQWVHVFVCASMHVSVCVWLCGQFLYVCVTVGQPLNRPPAVLKHWNSLPCSFFLCAACFRLSSHEIGPSLAPSEFACPVNGFSGVCQGPVGADSRTKRDKERRADPKLPHCPVAPLNHINNSYSGFISIWSLPTKNSLVWIIKK